MTANNPGRDCSINTLLLGISLFALCLFVTVFLVHLKHTLRTGGNLSHVYVQVICTDGSPVPEDVAITAVSPWQTEMQLRRTNNVWSVPDGEKRNVVKLRLGLSDATTPGQYRCAAALADSPWLSHTASGVRQAFNWVALSPVAEKAGAGSGLHSFALEGLKAPGSRLSARRACLNWQGDARLLKNSVIYAAIPAGLGWLLLGGVIGSTKRRWCEWLIPLAGACSLLGVCWVVSDRAPMWIDELYTYYTATNESFADFVQSHKSLINATPPLYFFLAWAAAKIIPLSALPLSLRVFSSLGFGIGLLLLWATLRRYTSFFIASVAALAVCLTSGLLLEHNAEARFYGMYFALFAWIVYGYDRLCADMPPRRQLLANTLAHALAVSCTYVAGLYSLAVLLSLMIRDRSLRVWRPKVYASVIAGWIPVLFHLPLIWAQRGSNAFFRPPGLGAIFHPFPPGLDLYFPLCGLMALAVIRGLGKENAPEPARHPAKGPLVSLSQFHLLILGCVFVALPYLFLALSWAGVPLLIDRYMFPSLIGIALLFALLCSSVAGAFPYLSEEGRMARPGIIRLAEKVICLVTFGGLLAYPFEYTRHFPYRYANPIRGMDVSQTVLATSSSIAYFVACFESGDSRNIYFILPDRKFCEQWRRFSHRLNPVVMADFLAAHEKFQVIADDRWGAYAANAWFEEEFRNSGAFDVKTEEGWPSSQAGIRLLTVSRKQVSTPAP